MYPNLFKVGFFTVHSYGLLLALAFLFGLRVSLHYGRRERIESSLILDLVFYIFVAAIIGAKLLEVIVDFRYYQQDWRRLLDIYQFGGVYYGGFLLAVLVSVWFIRKHRMNTWRTIDALSIGLAGGQILGRLGCFLAGCCWGKPASAGFPLAVTFRNAAAAQQVGTPLGIPLHPAQLYEASFLLLLFLFLIYLFGRRKFDGQIFLTYLLCYSLLRFFVEFFRGDPRGSVFGGLLSTSQFISLLVFASAAILYLPRRKVGRTKPLAK
jgi:phosphatidylglycerol:prolipoprotein diacylglycerol transferase